MKAICKGKVAEDTSFRFESDLVDVLDQQLQSTETKWASAPCGTLRELSTGRSTADLVAWWNDGSSDGISPGLLTTSECVLLSHLRKRRTTRIDILEVLCGAERGTFRHRSLGNLIDRGIVSQGRGGRIGLTSEWPPEMRVVAFEVKLTRWRSALEQALVYRLFADQVYVVLPESTARNAVQHLDMFSSSGVGLLCARSGAVHEVHPAERIPLCSHDWRREFALSRILNCVKMQAVEYERKRSDQPTECATAS